MNHSLDLVFVDCPYCGESIELLVDASVESQQYVEDCSVCCRPIELRVFVDAEGEAKVEARREDE